MLPNGDRPRAALFCGEITEAANHGTKVLKVHAIGAATYKAIGDVDLSKRHIRLSAVGRKGLADRLPEGDPSVSNLSAVADYCPCGRRKYLDMQVRDARPRCLDEKLSYVKSFWRNHINDEGIRAPGCLTPVAMIRHPLTF